MSQQLVLSIVQMLWDRGETNGYARVMTGNPLPDTPAHKVLMNIGVGDHQVTNYSAETEARTSALRIHTPIVYNGRWPNVDRRLGNPADRELPVQRLGARLLGQRPDPARPK